MQELVNPYKHITSELAELCSRIGGMIDKKFTGNGFTTAHSNMVNNSGKPDILIVPNIQTAKDKKDNKRFAKGKKVLYFHSESDNIIQGDYSNVDYIVCVADTYYHKELYKIPCRYTLLDEVHTAKIQSDFRPILYKLFEVLQTKERVSYVTATLYTNDVASVVIKNTHKRFTEQKKVHVSLCYKRTLAEIKKAKGRVLIASNEAKKVSRILKDAGINEIGLIVGKGFKKSFFKYSKVKINEGARVTIMTTRGFEGHDVMDKDVSIFVFQNYDATHVQYLDAQLIQVLGRARLKPKYLHINWCGGSYGGSHSETTIKFKNELEDICNVYCRVFNNSKHKRVESEDFKFSYKNNKIRLGSIRKFIIYEDANFSIEKKRIAKVNYIACDVLRNKLNIHANGLNEQYFKEHGYDVIKYADKPYNLKLSNVNNSIKTKNLIWNREHNPDYISKGQLIRGCFDIGNVANFKKVYDVLKEYMRDEMPLHLDYFFKINKSTDQVLKNCLEFTKQNYRQKKKAIPPLEHVESDVIEIIKCFVKYSRPKQKIRAFRDYNVFTATSTNVIDYIASLFNLKKYRFDISALAPTVLQALAGDKKHDVYESGENRKKSKKQINTYLNSIFKDARNSERIFKKLEQTNFSDKTLKLLKSDFYKTDDSSLLFNTYTLYERDIIQQAIRTIDNWSNHKHLIVARHDEINIFMNDIDEDTFKRLEYDYAEILSKIECLNYLNWFGFVPKKEVLKNTKKTPKIHAVPLQLKLAL